MGIAGRGVETTKRLGRHRWTVERTFACLFRYRRLTTRYERETDTHEVFLELGCVLVCSEYLRRL